MASSISRLHYYDSSSGSSSNELSDSDPELMEDDETTENLSKDHKYSCDDVPDEVLLPENKKLNIIYKLYNREVNVFI